MEPGSSLKQSTGIWAELLAAIGDAAEVAVYGKDLAGRYLWANAMAQAVSGLGLDEIIGRTDFQILPKSQAEEFRQIDMQIIASLSDRVCTEVSVTLPDGNQRVYENISKPLHDASGELIGLVGTGVDITERKRLEEELRRQRLLLNTILDHVDAHIYMRDEQYRFHYVNRKSAALFDKSPDEIIGKCVDELMDVETAARIQQLDCEVFRTGKTCSAQDEFVDSEGRKHYFWTVKAPLDPNPDGLRMLVGISTEITELREAHEKMRRLSLTDSLTSLRNRRDFIDHMGSELSRARRSKTLTALLLMDLDHFKSVNDRFGHLVGDQVLVRLAELIHSMIRREDFAGRLGGEEFGVLMPATDEASALNAAERLRRALAEVIFPLPDGQSFQVTMSIGVVVCKAGQLSSEEFYRRADQAMYRAKHAGRNCVRT